MDSTLSIKNASGKTFSLLNDNSSFTLPTQTSPMMSPPKRKYHCNEPGCNKSFTTSGHLARHHRIHTGEKNFHCLHPGCPSRFSRQDNMMQHYRTHLSQKIRRQHARSNQKKIVKNETPVKQLPQLYSHSYHGPEDSTSYRPLVNRPKRSITMPSLPYPNIMIEPKILNRPRRALSTSSTCSTSSSSYLSPPANNFYEYQQPHKHINMLPPPIGLINPSYEYPVANYRQQNFNQQQNKWAPNAQKPLSNLLHLANIVSTFG